MTSGISSVLQFGLTIVTREGETIDCEANGVVSREAAAVVVARMLRQLSGVSNLAGTWVAENDRIGTMMAAVGDPRYVPPLPLLGVNGLSYLHYNVFKN